MMVVTSIAVSDEMEGRNILWILFIQSGRGSYSCQCFAWLCNPMGTCVMTNSGDEFVVFYY
jgi:hypothetical protein